MQCNLKYVCVCVFKSWWELVKNNWEAYLEMRVGGRSKKIPEIQALAKTSKLGSKIGATYPFTWYRISCLHWLCAEYSIFSQIPCVMASKLFQIKNSKEKEWTGNLHVTYCSLSTMWWRKNNLATCVYVEWGSWDIFYKKRHKINTQIKIGVNEELNIKSENIKCMLKRFVTIV